MLIAHATELTGDDTAAFVHASALAAASRARLVTVHGNAPPDLAALLPDAAVLAARWGLPIQHERRCHECCDEVVETVIDFLHALAPQLVVLGTHARHGMAAWLHGSVGEAIARNVAVPTLVVPNRSRGFVDAATGAIDLRAIVIPAGSVVDAARGIAAARAIAELAHTPNVEITLVHVGDDDTPLEHFGLPVIRARGGIEAAVIEAARDACLIVMPTRGHDALGDVLVGSHTERVIRDAPCPVLSVHR